MAVVKMKQIKSTLHKAIVYITDPSKTENGTLVSTNYTDATDNPTLMADAMLMSVDMTVGGRRTGGVLAHHVVHSLSPEDSKHITSQQMHEMGIAFADEITNGEYQYVIATHVDRDHLHNHIIICSANTVTHRKMRVRKDTLAQWRAISDRLCEERGLNVIPERRNQRHGMSLAELYASTKGDAIKDRIRLAIDTAASSATDFDSFSRALHREGVTVIVRGRHLTFTDVASGLRVRDVRLGRAYDELNIMARIGRHTVMPISFNRRMIAERTDSVVRVWLPDTRRRLLITIPLAYIVRDGDTYRAYLPAASQQVITGRQGRYVKRVSTEDLYGYFSRPPTLLEPVARERMPVMVGKSEAQRRWYVMQARRLDQLYDLANELNTASRLVEDHVTVDDAIGALMTRIESERDGFQALLVALDEEPDIVNSGNLVGELATELREREQRLDALTRELNTLQRVRGQARQSSQRRRVRQPE